MLLTLSATSLSSMLGREGGPADLFGVPEFCKQEFDLQGLTVQTGFLSGWSMSELERLAHAADKAGCPLLTVVESEPHALAAADPQAGEQMLKRLQNVLLVAHRLGCSQVAVAIAADDTEATFGVVVDRLKSLVGTAERLELNLLISPRPGLTESPDRLTALIRKVGGFRVGSFPDFRHAADSGDADAYLRAVTPYASAAVTPTVAPEDSPGIDLAKSLSAILAVGFEQGLAIEYRGSGDPVPAIAATRDAIVAALAADEA